MLLNPGSYILDESTGTAPVYIAENLDQVLVAELLLPGVLGLVQAVGIDEERPSRGLKQTERQMRGATGMMLTMFIAWSAVVKTLQRYKRVGSLERGAGSFFLSRQLINVKPKSVSRPAFPPFLNGRH